MVAPSDLARVTADLRGLGLHRFMVPFREDVVQGCRPRTASLRDAALLAASAQAASGQLLSASRAAPRVASCGMTLLRLYVLPRACGVRTFVGALPNALRAMGRVCVRKTLRMRLRAFGLKTAARCHVGVMPLPHHHPSRAIGPSAGCSFRTASQAHHPSSLGSLISLVCTFEFPSEASLCHLQGSWIADGI